MIYRIIIEVGYHEAEFNFSDLNEAAEFAKVALIHQNICKNARVRLEVANPEEE